MSNQFLDDLDNEQLLRNKSRLTKTLLLYDSVAENVSMIGIYDTDKQAFRSFTDFIFMRRYNYKDFKVFSICDVDVKDIVFSIYSKSDVTESFHSLCSQVFNRL